MDKFIEKFEQLGGYKSTNKTKKISKIEKEFTNLNPKNFQRNRVKKKDLGLYLFRERERERDFGFITLLFSVSMFLKWLLLRGQGKDM